MDLPDDDGATLSCLCLEFGFESDEENSGQQHPVCLLNKNRHPV